jgi:muramidase (phage lysozyme)
MSLSPLVRADSSASAQNAVANTAERLCKSAASNKIRNDEVNAELSSLSNILTSLGVANSNEIMSNQRQDSIKSKLDSTDSVKCRKAVMNSISSMLQM